MFWDNPNDSPGMQRFKNQAFLKLPFTNKTRDEMLPALGGAGLIIGIALIAVLLLGLLVYAC